MKKYILHLIALIAIHSHAQTIGPNKICYDYDAAGNRIAQNPAWASQVSATGYHPDCNCNDPDQYQSDFGIKTFKLNKWEELDWVLRFIWQFNPKWLVSWDSDLDNPPKEARPDIPLIGSTIDGSEELLRQTSTDETIQAVRFIILNTEKRSEANPAPSYSAQLVPNPTENGKFQIVQKGFQTEQAKIIITDCRGLVLMAREYIDGYVHIGEHADGTYHVVLTDGIHTEMMRLIKATK